MKLILPLLTLLSTTAVRAGDYQSALDRDQSQQPLQQTQQQQQRTYTCGEPSIILTGFIPDDPEVLAMGYDPDAVRAGLKADQRIMVEAGYNARVALIASDNTHYARDLALELEGHDYDAVVIGFGIRGSRAEKVGYLFTDLIRLFRRLKPEQPVLFNWNPTSTSVAVGREFPILQNCSAALAENLGWAEYPL